MKEIGIKLADGTFYPILSESVRSQKIELTTVHDKQETVHINLFRKDVDLEYIGSLIIEDIAQKKAGDSTIDLNLELDEDDNLKAEAVDADTGVNQALKVSLAAIAPNVALSGSDIGDFNLSEISTEFSSSTTNENIISEQDNITFDGESNYSENHENVSEQENDDLSYEKEDSHTESDATVYEQNAIHTEKDETINEKKSKRKKFPWLVVLLSFLGIVLLVLLILFLTRSCSKLSTTSQIFEPKTDVAESTSTSVVPIPSDEELAKQNKETDETQITPSTTENDDTNGESETDKLIESSTTETDDTDNKTEEADQSESLTTETDKTNDKLQGDEASKSQETEANNMSDKPKENEVSETPTAEINTTGSSQIITNPDGSVRYLLKWGDTLWDLAQTFYKDPWKYTVIAEHNNIKDPSFIITGTYIDIPPR